MRVVLFLLFIVVLVALWMGLLSYQEIIRFFIKYVLVPIILLGGVFLAGYIAYLPTENPDLRISKWMAFLLGLSAFGLVVVLDVFMQFFKPLKSLAFESTLWILVLVGLATGVGLAFSLSRRMQGIGVALLVALLAGGSLIIVYFHFVMENLQRPLITLTMGLLVGVIGFLVFVPSVVRNLMPKA